MKPRSDHMMRRTVDRHRLGKFLFLDRAKSEILLAIPAGQPPNIDLGQDPP
ncbi:hypothetical protein IQ238_26295 [Pleurocapsales cyanobacterium LEGE 06147]|nr:hypothetical protein [Pleurocapsales cyanobacterium LEGE 06147]